ncbi:MAG: AAA family ATPase [Methanobacteriota archaeon]
MKVIAVAGMPGSGKDEVVRIAADLGFSVVRMGDVVREEAARRGLPMEDKAVGGMAHQERVERGFGIWAERTLPRLKGDAVLIDGLRGKAELDVFRRAFGDRLVVVAIHASPATRYARMAARRRADDAASLAALRERDERELAWGLGDVLATAEVLLVNEGDLETFRRSARDALTSRTTAA